MLKILVNCEQNKILVNCEQNKILVSCPPPACADCIETPAVVKVTVAGVGGCLCAGSPPANYFKSVVAVDGVYSLAQYPGFPCLWETDAGSVTMTFYSDAACTVIVATQVYPMKVRASRSAGTWTAVVTDGMFTVFSGTASTDDCTTSAEITNAALACVNMYPGDGNGTALVEPQP